MSDRIFAALAHGIADASTGMRIGSRHALIVYTRTGTIDEARRRSRSYAMANGWTVVEVEECKAIDVDPSQIPTEAHRASVRDALEHGNAMVVYTDEVVPDA